MILLELLLGFLKVGLFSFGGAYAAVPLIRETVLSYGWITEEMLTDIIAVSESTPGPIMVNLATYVGSTQAGIPGALIATFATVLPAFIIILLIMVALKSLIRNPWFQAALDYMKPCISGIILASGACILVKSCMAEVMEHSGDIRSVILAAGFALVMFGLPKFTKKRVSPIALIGISAILGAIVFSI